MNNGSVPCGVRCECWEFSANRPRREMPAGAAPLFFGNRLHVCGFCDIIKKTPEKRAQHRKNTENRPRRMNKCRSKQNMVFSSLYFLYLFLPVCLLCYGLSPSLTVKNITLTAFSLIFYAWGEPTYILLLLLSVLMNYLFGLGIGGFQKKDNQSGAKAVMIVSQIGRAHV